MIDKQTHKILYLGDNLINPNTSSKTHIVIITKIFVNGKKTPTISPLFKLVFSR